MNIDSDVLERARSVSKQYGMPFRKIINEALRAGLDRVTQDVKQKPYRPEPRALGLKPGRNLDNIQALLAQVEGEDFR